MLKQSLIAVVVGLVAIPALAQPGGVAVGSEGPASAVPGPVVESEESTVTVTRREEVPSGVVAWVPVLRPLLNRGSVSGGIGGAIGGRSVVGVTPPHNADLVAVP